MTPLAHRIVKELTLPVKRRTFKDKGGLLPRMSDVHCFELSGVVEEFQSLASDIYRRPGSADILAFLPAPKTWLEWKVGGGRYGFLLEETQFGADARIALDNERGFRSGALVTQIALRETLLALEPGDITLHYDADQTTLDDSLKIQFGIYGALALINTPRIFGRRQYMPHRGLQRDLVREKKTVGKFPLHAWTEIKLEIADPRDAADTPSKSVHYTGERARHFCRTHLRIRLGKVEIVRWHERGNKLFGIKQSRYRLTSKSKDSKSKEEYVS